VVRQPARSARSSPEHATIRLRLPWITGRRVRPRHLMIGAAILGAGLASLAEASGGAHRVDAATPPGSTSASPTAIVVPAPSPALSTPRLLPPIQTSPSSAPSPSVSPPSVAAPVVSSDSTSASTS